MRWQDVKLLLFLLLVAVILFLLLKILDVDALSMERPCTEPTKIGGALVIGEKPCDDGAEKEKQRR